MDYQLRYPKRCGTGQAINPIHASRLTILVIVGSSGVEAAISASVDIGRTCLGSLSGLRSLLLHVV